LSIPNKILTMCRQEASRTLGSGVSVGSSRSCHPDAIHSLGRAVPSFPSAVRRGLAGPRRATRRGRGGFPHLLGGPAPVVRIEPEPGAVRHHLPLRARAPRRTGQGPSWRDPSAAQRSIDSMTIRSSRTEVEKNFRMSVKWERFGLDLRAMVEVCSLAIFRLGCGAVHQNGAP